jgi:uncharacterized membrane protein YeaQ/YmgE (transglycosylase-associated protein family)
MPFILGALLVLMAIWIFFSFAGSLMHLLLMLVIAGIVGWLADAVVPGRLPWGWLGAILAGLVGSWLGVFLLGIVGLGHIGPAIAGVPIIPAFVGAVVLAFLADFAGKQMARSRAIEPRV